MDSFAQPMLELCQVATQADVDCLHQQFRSHAAECRECSPVPTIGLCEAGATLEANRDTMAISLMKSAAEAAAARDIAIHPNRTDTVVFAIGDGLRGGIFFSAYNATYRAIVGSPTAALSRANSTYCKASEITQTILDLAEPLRCNGYRDGGENHG